MILPQVHFICRRHTATAAPRARGDAPTPRDDKPQQHALSGLVGEQGLQQVGAHPGTEALSSGTPQHPERAPCALQHQPRASTRGLASRCCEPRASAHSSKQRGSAEQHNKQNSHKLTQGMQPPHPFSFAPRKFSETSVQGFSCLGSRRGRRRATLGHGLKERRPDKDAAALTCCRAPTASRPSVVNTRA
jgi:hypothetical protein